VSIANASTGGSGVIQWDPWNRWIMDRLRRVERSEGSRLARDEIIHEGRKLMRKSGSRGRFKSYRGE
jgi:hypothetical protein